MSYVVSGDIPVVHATNKSYSNSVAVTFDAATQTAKVAVTPSISFTVPLSADGSATFTVSGSDMLSNADDKTVRVGSDGTYTVFAHVDSDAYALPTELENAPVQSNTGSSSAEQTGRSSHDRFGRQGGQTSVGPQNSAPSQQPDIKSTNTGNRAFKWRNRNPDDDGGNH